MDPEQLKVFREITLHYFSKLAPESPAPKPAESFIRFEKPEFLDYASLVRISGPLEGCVYITASKETMNRLLELHRTGELTESRRLDMCREFSNVLSGNASNAFGSDWHISVPRSLTADETGSLDLPTATFTMPVAWLGDTFYVVIGLEDRRDGTGS